MDDRIGRLAANAGVDRTAAENAVGIILQFLSKEGPTAQAHIPIQRRPCSGAAVLAVRSSHVSGATGGLMSVGAKARAAAAPPPAQVMPAIRDIIRVVREMLGKMQSARPLLRFPAPVSSSDACWR